MSTDTVRISADDVSYLSDKVVKLGSYAETLLDSYDLGIRPEELAHHIRKTCDNLGLLFDGGSMFPITLKPSAQPNVLLDEEVGDTWDWAQTLRYAAGASMISQRYAKHMSQENLKRSLLAKVLYKCQTGILDDLVDKGRYSYMEARGIYHHVLASMTDLDFDPNAFKKKLIPAMNQNQIHIFDLISTISSSFNRLFIKSPHGVDLFYHMEVLDERVILGQAITMFQKEETLNVGKIRSIAKNFYAPADDIMWHERLAAYVSGGTRYNLIDMSFTDKEFGAEELQHFLVGWYYFDIAVVFLNNIVNIYHDLKDGIANLSLIAMREDEICSIRKLKNYSPTLTIEDYKGHIARIAQLAGRAIAEATKDFEDTENYYPFITIMMPVVMMAEWIGKRDDLICSYLEELSPSLRKVSLKTAASA
ncbi:MAG: hypothetical protein ACE5IO_03280 [Thermoplasmata archaeon]